MTIKAHGSVTIQDILDAIRVGTAPSNPKTGMLWIDTSSTPNTLKKWSGSSWVPQTLDLSNLDPQKDQIITTVNETLGTITDDNIIDIVERQAIKDRLTEIIGFVISDDSATLPTTSALDLSTKGNFYSVRKAAQLAGISTSDSVYVATATNWTSLKTYLEGMSPINGWDTSAGNKSQTISVVKLDFRNKWLNYYLSIQNLAQKTADTLKQAAQNAQNTADSKIKNFVVQPTTPYKVGDTWQNGDAQYVCHTTRLTGAFSLSDWQLGSDITGNNTSQDTNNVNGTPSTQITTTIENHSATLSTQAEQISAKVDSSTYTQTINDLNESMGKDKWQFKRYNRGSVNQGVAPTYDTISGLTTVAEYLVNDGSSIIQNITDNYIGYLKTAVYVSSAKNISFSYHGDDSSRLYVNGMSKHSMNTGTSPSLTIPLNQGWNTVEFIWVEGTGDDGIWAVTPTIGSQVDKMSCYYSTSDGRLSQAEAELSIQADEISSKVSSTDYNGQTIISKVNQTADTYKIQAKNIELTGAVTISAFGSDVNNKLSGLNSDGSISSSANIAGTSAGTVVDRANGANSYADSVSQAKADLAETRAKAYADGIVSTEEQRAIQDAQQKYDDAVNHANQAVDNLQVGGRNLAKGTSDSFQSITFGDGDMTISTVPAKQGDKFTARIYLKPANQRPARVTIQFMDIDGIRVGYASDSNTIIAGQEGYSTTTATAPDNTVSATMSIRRPDDTGVSDIVQYKEAKLEYGDKATDWSPAPEDQQAYADSVAQAKADLANTYTDGQISTVNGSITSLQQNAQNAGGVNLLKNSLGIATVVDDTDPNYGKMLNWVHYTADNCVEYPVTNGDIQALNFMGGIYIQASSTNWATVRQKIYCPNDTISIGFYVSSDTLDGGSGSYQIGVEVWDENDTTKISSIYLSTTGAVNNLPFRYISGSVSGLTANTVTIRVVCSPNSKGIITGLMVNDGPLPLRWSSYPYENYTTQIQLDQNGIRVLGETSDNYTEMTPDKFSGFAPDAETGEKTEIFSLNGDITHVHKLKANRYLELGTVRAVTFDNGTNKGWAFFPTNNQN